MPPCAPRSMKMASPLDKGGIQGGVGAVTDNLVWVVDPKPTPAPPVRGRGFSRDRWRKPRANVRGLQRARTSALMAGEEKRWKKFPSKNPPRGYFDVDLPGFAICPSIPALALNFGNPGGIELR